MGLDRWSTSIPDDKRRFAITLTLVLLQTLLNLSMFFEKSSARRTAPMTLSMCFDALSL
jgi:hypothetical protein